MFYVTLDITRTIGLEKALPNLKIICLGDHPVVDVLQKNGTPVFCLERENISVQQRSSGAILQENKVVDWMEKNEKNPKILVFKPNAKIEKTVQKKGWKMLNPPFELNQRYEDKVTFTEICRTLNIKTPETVTKKIKDLTWNDMVKLGGKVIAQERRSHAGQQTYIISTHEELKKIIKNHPPEQILKIARWINGTTITLNCCLAGNDLHLSPLMEQISGIPQLNSNPYGTCGVKVLSDRKIPQELTRILDKLSEDMKKRGYFGIFGIDAIQTENNEIFLIECNPRLTATISFFTQLEQKNNIIPHITLMVDKSVKPNKNRIRQNACQIILRNTQNKNIMLRHKLKNGIYTIQDDRLVCLSESVSFQDLKNDSEALLLIKKSGDIISSGMEIGFMQSLGPLVDDNNQVENMVSHIFKKINRSTDTIFVDEKDFWENRYGIVTSVCDVLKQPFDNPKKLTDRAITRNRQTQLLPNEPTVRLLAEHGAYFLVQKYDDTRGWVEKTHIQKTTESQKSHKPNAHHKNPKGFFETWLHSPYRWGGITTQGVDCSGFVQQYYQNVLHTVLPKNSKDQRKIGVSIKKEELQNNDLIFMKSIQSNTHHVGIYQNGLIYHACLKKKGVTKESLQEISKRYNIEEYKRIKTV